MLKMCTTVRMTNENLNKVRSILKIHSKQNEANQCKN